MTQSTVRHLFERQSYPDTGESGEAYEAEESHSIDAIRLYAFRIRDEAIAENSESGEAYEAEVRWSREEETLDPVGDESEPLEI